MNNPEMFATATEDKLIKVDFSKSELAEKKESIINKVIQLDKINEDLSDIKSTYKERIKPITVDLTGLKLDLRRGYKEEYQEVFLVPDQDTGNMEYWTKAGELVDTRKLRPEERQLIMNLGVAVNDQRTGTNDE